MLLIQNPVAGMPRRSAGRSQPWQPKQGRRTLVDLSPMVHCSVVGTCLTLAELRKLVRKLSGNSIQELSDHDVHTKAVRLASVRGSPSKLLNKALEEKHQAVIRRFNNAESEADVAVLWREAVQQGQIEGAYWAVATHPLSGEAFFVKVFGDVHMLSHLVGCTNRADIRRLVQLDAEIASLRGQFEDTHGAMRLGFSRRDKEIQELRKILAQTIHSAAPSMPRDEELSALRTTVSHLQRQLDAAKLRVQNLEASARAIKEEKQNTASRLQDTQELNAQLEKDIRVLESYLEEEPSSAGASNAFCGKTILYVGGKSGFVDRLRSIGETVQAILLHHDGGQAQNISLLAGLIQRADYVFFPVDCVSHQAMYAVKKYCELNQTRFFPLRRSGAASFLRTITEVAANEEMSLEA